MRSSARLVPPRQPTFSRCANPAPPEPSNPQRWLSLAAEDDLLADALRYFGRGDDWFDIYKALECLIGRFGGGRRRTFSRWAGRAPTRLSCLSGLADFWRHSPRGRPKVVPPPNPMERTEARRLLAKLIARALDEVPATPPPSGSGRRAQAKGWYARSEPRPEAQTQRTSRRHHARARRRRARGSFRAL